MRLQSIIFNENRMIQSSDADHPITNVADAIRQHYGCGWSPAEDVTMQVWKEMKKQGWTLNPPNDMVSRAKQGKDNG